jgi:type I restriction enzyme M protein
MLVENSLVAVISLPAGCFNPYSGVKTSILILDKSLAKAADTIAFFKVENDGFGLGAQRRAIEKNDLPQVQAELAAYLDALRTASPVEALAKTGQIVPKKKIAANGDYNLSGERYREGAARTSFFPNVPLGEVCDLIGGATPSKQDESYWTNGSVKWISSKHIDERGLITAYELISKKAVEETSTRVAPAGSTIIITRVSVGKFAFADNDYAINQDLTALVTKDNERLAPEFIRVAAHHIAQVVERNAEGIGVRGVTRSFLSELQIPLPPLEVQKEIVAEIEGYQKVINGARAVLDHYRPHIPIHPDWPKVRLADVCETITDGDHMPPPKAPEGVPFVTITNISDEHELDFTKTFFVPEAYYSNLSDSRRPRGGDILYTVTGSYGIPVLVPENIRFCFQRHIALIRTGPQLLNRFLVSLLASPFMLQQGHEAATGVAQKTVSLGSLRGFQIPHPPLVTQQAIVAEIEAEQALVAANRELITRFERKIQATLARIWGEESPDVVAADMGD